MDYKEKYEKALEGIQEILGSGEDSIKMSRLQLRLQGIFPELKESEDERIRKAIHIYLDWLDGKKDYAPRGEYTINDMIDWIEKQGKHQKFRDSIQVGDKVTRNKDGVLVNLSQLERVAKPAKNQDVQQETLCGKCRKEQPSHSCQDITALGRCAVEHEQKPAEFDDANAKRMFIKALERVEEQNNKGYKLTDCDKNSWWEDFKAYTSCTIEQKPWSEEEEKKQNYLIALLQNSTMNNPDLRSVNEGLEEWLKSLKDRVQPQPKQEWSEEDEQTFIKSVEALEDFGKFELADWLKEHKNQFLKPQNTWKPSDEQMDALHYVTNFDYGGHKSTLVSLYEQLKKLKG